MNRQRVATTLGICSIVWIMKPRRIVLRVNATLGKSYTQRYVCPYTSWRSSTPVI